MKKWIMSSLAILLGILSISIPLAGVRTAEAGTTEDSGKKLKIVTTIFPEYDWTRAVLGDREADVDLTMLLDNGTDPLLLTVRMRNWMTSIILITKQSSA